jgi:antidote-toxin recognition MazE-like antitoxin
MRSKPKRKPAGRKRRPLTSREKVRAHRARMRAQGLRPVTLWLPDTRSPEFAAQAHRASLAIAKSPSENEDQASIDSVSWWNSESNVDSGMKTLTVRLPEALVAQIENESSERKLSISDVVRERLSADVTGSVDGLPTDLSARKKSHLKASGYGRKRPR